VGRSPVAVPLAPPYPQYTLLPVPDPNAPIGNVSGVPSVPVSGARPRPTTPVASRASELGLRYRVVVPAASATVQDRVLSVFPGAFLTYDRRQSVVMQVGAFNSEANAQEVIDILRQNGVRAQIERVD
jgi:cell division septation protein DedD